MQSKLIPINNNVNQNINKQHQYNNLYVKQDKKYRQNELKENQDSQISFQQDIKRLQIESYQNNNDDHITESFIIKETQKIKRNYLNSLMNNEVKKNHQIFRSNFLQNHNVSSEVRVRMVIVYFNFITNFNIFVIFYE